MFDVKQAAESEHTNLKLEMAHLKKAVELKDYKKCIEWSRRVEARSLVLDCLTRPENRSPKGGGVREQGKEARRA